MEYFYAIGAMKRLVWNFEIDSSNPLQWQDLKPEIPDEVRWEVRFFWAEDEIISLQGLSEQFLDLSRYQIKHREDIYFILPSEDINIKIRREQLLYKPLYNKTEFALAYGKKIKLNQYSSDTALPGTQQLTAATLIPRIYAEGIEIQVRKEALIYKVPTSPEIKLEFARLKAYDKIFFSFSIETHAAEWIKQIRNRLLGEAISCDYVTFLKTLFKP